MMITIWFYLEMTLYYVPLNAVFLKKSSINYHYGRNWTVFPQVAAIRSYDLRGWTWFNQAKLSCPYQKNFTCYGYLIDYHSWVPNWIWLQILPIQTLYASSIYYWSLSRTHFQTLLNEVFLGHWFVWQCASPIHEKGYECMIDTQNKYYR